MDKCIHKKKPPNFGGFFVASHKTKAPDCYQQSGAFCFSRIDKISMKHETKFNTKNLLKVEGKNARKNNHGNKRKYDRAGRRVLWESVCLCHFHFMCCIRCRACCLGNHFRIALVSTSNSTKTIEKIFIPIHQPYSPPASGLF